MPRHDSASDYGDPFADEYSSFVVESDDDDVDQERFVPGSLPNKKHLFRK